MIWTDARIDEARVALEGRTLAQAAATLSDRWNEYITEQMVRGAIRRWGARQQRDAERAAHGGGGGRVDVREAPVPIAVTNPPENGVVLFGALGDTHLCSKYERLDMVHMMYAIYESEGVQTVFHTGNYIEGEARFNQNDIAVHGMDNQLRYFVANYPKNKGITTYYVDGDDHEGWYTQREGVNVGERLEDIARREGRDDLKYLGYMEQDIKLSPNSDKFIRVIHPGGGSAQAVSWTSQKIIGAIEHDDAMPYIMLVGHYHKAEFLPNYRGVNIFQTGTFQEQSPFMRKKLLRADVGAWIVRVRFQDGQPVSVGGDYIPFKRKAWKHL